MSEITRGPVTLVQGDITAMETGAIVNPSNTQLILGAGVSGAIRTKGGDEIQEEMNKIGHCPLGGAVATGAGKLKTDYVIHAVGPRMGEGDEDEKLKSATVESLKRAEELSIDSVAFPAISTGVFGFPVDRCAAIMLGAAYDHFDSGAAKSLTHVVFCLWGDDAFHAFAAALDQVRPE